MSTPARNAVVVPDGPLPMLPAALWVSKEVLDAVAAESPGAVVAIARKAHGLRQDELGTLAGFSQSAISRLEAGSNIAYDMRVLRTLQRLLGIPAHLLGLTDRTVPMRSGEALRLGGVPGLETVAKDLVVGMEGKALMALCASAVFGTTNANGVLADDAVSQLLVLRRIVNDAHNWRGTGALMPAVRNMYDFIDVLRRNARGDVRRRLLGTGAMYAEFYGWLHEEIGDLRNAGAWTSRALEQGQAADDRDVVAYCYVRMSQLAEVDGDDDRVIGLARAAQRETARARSCARWRCGRRHVVSHGLAWTHAYRGSTWRGRWCRAWNGSRPTSTPSATASPNCTCRSSTPRAWSTSPTTAAPSTPTTTSCRGGGPSASGSRACTRPGSLTRTPPAVTWTRPSASGSRRWTWPARRGRS
ncbi:helix-turn-helix transcriptional regulator [Lentzea sp. PSKA42]|uniref:Helix-turn-helix transcriptional regulator n=1 Tax=Lentzea indica TaxID=2604800 RepID=A0ABX1FLP1_9PSEU|nr:helix-turn-helix transcriptional regulator [Lentzea indica]NKE59913.1 helix-turn-helix transcriptional regulator [Lentzea indica]